MKQGTSDVVLIVSVWEAEKIDDVTIAHQDDLYTTPDIFVTQFCNSNRCCEHPYVRY